MLPRVEVTRYVTPLREGGSLPGLMEADDLGTYVVKFRGAGQGVKVLAAEVIAAALARLLDLPVPDLVVADLDPGFAAGEPDEEVQELLRASGGENLGVDFLPGALDADRAAVDRGADSVFAGRVLWFDAFVNNVDRTWRNPNMLWWGPAAPHRPRGVAHLPPQLADVGCRRAAPVRPRDHVMAGARPDLAAAADFAVPRLTREALVGAVAGVPDGWLVAADAGPDDVRARYVDWLQHRLDARSEWVPS